jgi:hypothetical protein
MTYPAPTSDNPRAERALITFRALQAVAEDAGAEWRPLQAIATRESQGNFLVIHDLPQDAQGAAKVWEREQRRLYKDNPFRDPKLWSVGRGAYGQMTPYHVWRWSSTAHPYILHHPYLSAVVALRTVAGVVAGNPRATWLDVNEAWSSGRSKNQSAASMERRERFRARLERAGIGHLADLRPVTSSAGRASWGRRPQEGQLDRIAAIQRAAEQLGAVPRLSLRWNGDGTHGRDGDDVPSRGDATPPPDGTAAASVWPWAAGVAVAIGVAGAIAAAVSSSGGVA